MESPRPPMAWTTEPLSLFRTRVPELSATPRPVLSTLPPTHLLVSFHVPLTAVPQVPLTASEGDGADASAAITAAAVAPTRRPFFLRRRRIVLLAISPSTHVRCDGERITFPGGGPAGKS